MKSIFYVGAALMLGASVYGFVDYRNAKSKKEFNELYNSKGQPKTEKVKPTVPESKEAVKIQKTKSAVIDEQDPATIDKKIEITTLAEKTTSLTSAKTTHGSKKQKHGKRKKLSYKLFSRAAPVRSFEPPLINHDEEATTKPDHH